MTNSSNHGDVKEEDDVRATLKTIPMYVMTLFFFLFGLPPGKYMTVFTKYMVYHCVNTLMGILNEFSGVYGTYSWTPMVSNSQVERCHHFTC